MVYESRLARLNNMIQHSIKTNDPWKQTLDRFHRTIFVLLIRMISYFRTFTWMEKKNKKNYKLRLIFYSFFFPFFCSLRRLMLLYQKGLPHWRCYYLKAWQWLRDPSIGNRSTSTYQCKQCQYDVIRSIWVCSCRCRHYCFLLFRIYHFHDRQISLGILQC